MFGEALGGGVTKRIDETVLVAAEIGVPCPAIEGVHCASLEVARGEDGGAPVSGLAGSSSKAAGAWRRRSSGGARGWWGTSTALRDGGGADQELCPSVGGRRRKKGHI